MFEVTSTCFKRFCFCEFVLYIWVTVKLLFYLKLFNMYHVHVITIFQCIMLVTGISFIIRMSYSFVSRSVIYLLFLNWHNVRYLFWITFNYMSECLNYPNLTKQFFGRWDGGVEGDCLSNENPLCCDKTQKPEWQVAGYLFCTNYLQSLCILKSKESCIQKGFVARSTFILGLMTLVLLLDF